MVKFTIRPNPANFVFAVGRIEDSCCKVFAVVEDNAILIRDQVPLVKGSHQIMDGSFSAGCHN
jgi:hypothetical protein